VQDIKVSKEEMQNLSNKIEDNKENQTDDGDNHHFDNPVYTTFRPASPQANIEPLNNIRLQNRLNNKNHQLEAERSTACAQYFDDDDLSDSTSERGIGCTGNGFSYSSLHRKKNAEADYCNPNIYTALDDPKDNGKLNVYDEINKGLSSFKPSNKALHRMSVGSNGGYDRLDFTRPHSELRPEYHSSHTLKSSSSKEDMLVDSGVSSARSTATVPWSNQSKLSSARSTGTVPWSYNQTDESDLIDSSESGSIIVAGSRHRRTPSSLSNPGLQLENRIPDPNILQVRTDLPVRSDRINMKRVHQGDFIHALSTEEFDPLGARPADTEDTHSQPEDDIIL